MEQKGLILTSNNWYRNREMGRVAFE